MTTFPIITLGQGAVSDPAWFADITDSVNDHEERLDSLESQVLTSSAQNTDPTTSRTTTSSGFTTTLSPANICGTAFVAPSSGKVLAIMRCTQANSVVNSAITTYQICEGSVIDSGTIFQSADDSRSLSTGSTTFEGWGSVEYVSGLTPGANYNIFLAHRVLGGGTMTVLRRTVGVVPLIV